MSLETNKFDIIYGRLLQLRYNIDDAKTLAKTLYELSDQLDLSVNEILKYITESGIKFNTEIYTKLNSLRTKSSQIGYINVTSIPLTISRQIR